MIKWRKRLEDCPGIQRKLTGTTARTTFAVGLVLCFLILFAAYLRISLSYPKNSDDADFVLRAQDILNGNILLRGWVSAPDSFYTVLLPSYVLGGLATGHMARLMSIVPAATYALLVVFCVAIAWTRVEPPRRFNSVLLILVLMGLPAVFFDGGLPIQSAEHKTTTFLILIGFYLLSSSYSLVLASLPLILAVIGDPFALWVGILAVAVVGLWLVSRGRTREGLRLVLFAVGCLLLSKLALVAIRLAGGYEMTPGNLRVAFVTLDGLPHNIYLLCECVLRLFDASPFGREVLALDTVIALVHLGVLIFLIWVAWRLFQARTEDTLRLLLLAALLLNVVAFVVSAVPVDLTSARYLPTLTIFGPLIAGMSWYEVGFCEKAAWAWVLAPLILVSYLIPFGRELVRPIAEPRLEVIEFLERQGLTEGYGSYWSSGILTVLSGGKVKVRQVAIGPQQKLVPLEWNSAQQWYAMDNARFLIYKDREFGVNLFTAIRTWGFPKDEKVIDGYVILTWPTPLHLAEGALRPH